MASGTDYLTFGGTGYKKKSRMIMDDPESVKLLKERLATENQGLREASMRAGYINDPNDPSNPRNPAPELNRQRFLPAIEGYQSGDMLPGNFDSFNPNWQQGGNLEALRVQTARNERKKQDALTALQEYGQKINPGMMAEREKYTGKGGKGIYSGPADVSKLNVLKSVDPGEIESAKRAGNTDRESRARAMGEISPEYRTNRNVPTSQLGSVPTPGQAYEEGGYAKKRTLDLLRAAIAKQKTGTAQQQLDAATQNKSVEELGVETPAKRLDVKSMRFSTKGANKTVKMDTTAYKALAESGAKDDNGEVIGLIDRVIKDNEKTGKIGEPKTWIAEYNKGITNSLIRGVSIEAYDRAFVKALMDNKNQIPYKVVMENMPELRYVLPQSMRKGSKAKDLPKFKTPEEVMKANLKPGDKFLDKDGIERTFRGNK